MRILILPGVVLGEKLDEELLFHKVHKYDVAQEEFVFGRVFIGVGRVVLHVGAT